LHVTLWDLFGDSWNGAEYYVEKPNGATTETMHTSPDCEHNPRLVRVTFDPVQSSGLYYMTVNTPGNYIPHEWWEIFWTVRVGETKEFYTGGFNTTMVWDFDLQNCQWHLLHYINLWNNTKDCDGCGGANACPAKKPKPAPKKGDAPPKKNGGGKGAGNGDGNGDNENEGDGNENEETGNMTVSSPSYGPRAVDVEVTMYDEEGKGWWFSNYLGTSWYIYDTSRTTLFETGTLCNHTNGACKLCLGDGSYIYRATYDKDNSTIALDTHDEVHNNFTSWDFCGVSGHYSDELHFHVKKGKCVADFITCLTDICDDVQVFANVQILGSMLVSDVSSNQFDAADSNVFVSAFVKEVTGIQVSNVAVLSSSLAIGTTQSFVVNFALNFVTDSSFALDGTANAAVDTLVSKMASSLNMQMANGEYVAAVHSLALSNKVGAMASVTSVSLLSFDLNAVTYTGSRDMVVGKTMTAEIQMADTYSGSAFDFASISFLLAFVGVGLIVVAGVYSRKMVAYSKLGQESTHEISQSLELDGGLVLPAVRSVSDRSKLTL